ncbi:MAG: hypothetical protein KGL39_22810 [Patescibacteria group bacterium]|nr:hypothetical protein [Patescibacteria group bacterium]
MNPESKSLTTKESTRFSHLDKVIERGKKAFVEVGLALMEIKDAKLYREKFKTFDEYCTSRGITKQHAYRLIEAAPVAQSEVKVTSQNAANALAKVPPPYRKQVVEEAEALGEGEVTAKNIKEVARKIAPVPIPKPKVLVDGVGIEIPKESLAMWQRNNEVQELLSHVSALRSSLKRAQEVNDPCYRECDFNDSLSKLNQVYADLSRAKAYAVCPSCNGIIQSIADFIKRGGKKDEFQLCPTCHNKGFVSEFYWDKCVPAELKKLITK